MRTPNLIFSAIHLCVGLFVIAIGVMISMIPYAEGIQEGLISFLMHNKTGVLTMGVVILSSGILLLVGFYYMYRKRYYKLEMGVSGALIEETIIKEYIHSYWAGLFPGSSFELEVVIGKGQQIEIVTQIPGLEEKGESFFERVKNELGVLLARKLGYEKEFVLTITD